MIDLVSESVVSLTEAAGHLPRRRNKPVHVATLYRWAQRGIRGVRLETIQCGGAKCTSLEALQRFFEQLSGEDGGHRDDYRTPAQRRRAQEQAERELQEAGW